METIRMTIDSARLAPIIDHLLLQESIDGFSRSY